MKCCWHARFGGNHETANDWQIHLEGEIYVPKSGHSDVVQGQTNSISEEEESFRAMGDILILVQNNVEMQLTWEII